MTVPQTPQPEVLRRDGLPGGVEIVNRADDGRANAGRCLLCGSVTYIGPCSDEALVTVMSTHLNQHAPGRVLDLGDLSWHVSATCPVCPDGGQIEVDPEGDLACATCGSWWDIDGRNGQRDEPDVAACG